MVYRFFKILMTIALRFFYRRMYVTGLEVIPPNGPAILLANHPSALMDAALIGVLLKRPVYFFTKGEVFVNKTINRLLDTLHMIPIHQHKGGKGTLNINDDSYVKAEEILSAGGIILFFPEGNSKTDHKLEPLRKGVFRMAFHAAADNDFRYDIPFIPVGINYQHPVLGNKDVMVNFDKPFFLGDYREDYETNTAATLLRMTKDGFDIMEKKVLHITNPENFALTEKCLTIQTNNYSFFTSDWVQATTRRFTLQKDVCNQVNEMSEESRIALKKNTDEYFTQLKTLGLQDSTLSPLFSLRDLKKVLLVIMAPLFLAGWLLNALPLIIARRIADTKVTRIDFYSWVLVAASAILYLIWLLILFIAFSLISWKYGMAMVLFTLATGFIYYHYSQWLRDYRQYSILKNTHPHIAGNLLTLRSKIVSFTAYRSLVHQPLPDRAG